MLSTKQEILNYINNSHKINELENNEELAAFITDMIRKLNYAVGNESYTYQTLSTEKKLLYFISIKQSEPVIAIRITMTNINSRIEFLKNHYDLIASEITANFPNFSVAKIEWVESDGLHNINISIFLRPNK